MHRLRGYGLAREREPATKELGGCAAEGLSGLRERLCRTRSAEWRCLCGGNALLRFHAVIGASQTGLPMDWRAVGRQNQGVVRAAGFCPPYLPGDSLPSMGWFNRKKELLSPPNGGTGTDQRVGEVMRALGTGDLDRAAEQLLEWSEASAFSVDGAPISAENDKGGIINLRRLADALLEFLEQASSYGMHPSGPRLFEILARIRGVNDAWQPQWNERFERISRTWG